MSTSTAAAGRSKTDRLSQRSLILLALLLGAAGIFYYVSIEARLAALYGRSAASDSIVFIGIAFGLCCAALLARLFESRRSRQACAVASIALAAHGVVVPWLIRGLASIELRALGSTQAPPAVDVAQLLMQALTVLLALSLPTFLIGSALSLGVAAGRSSDSAGSSAPVIGCIGGAGAALIAALIIVPLIGVQATVWLGVTLALAAGVTVMRPAQMPPPATAQPAREPSHTAVMPSGRLHVSRPSTAQHRARRAAVVAPPRLAAIWLLLCAAAAGASALGAQYLWLRLVTLEIAVGARSQLLMLAGATVGFALGGIALQRALAMSPRARVALIVVQIAAAVLTVVMYLWLGTWLASAEASLPDTMAIGVYALPALLLGTILSLVDEIDTDTRMHRSSSSLRVYAAGALGAGLGLLAVRGWLLPVGGFGLTAQVIAFTSIAAAILVMPFLMLRDRLLGGIAIVTVAVVVIALAPGRPVVATTIATTESTELSRPVQRVFVAGRENTVFAVERDGQFGLRGDQIVEESIPVLGSAPRQDPHQWLAALPVTARPDSRTLLSLGFASGLTLQGVPRSITRIDVIEPEPAFLAASRALAGERAADPLADARTTFIANDPRRALRLSEQRYDLIVSQYARPGTSLALALPTRELLALIRARLSDAGVYAQRFESAAIDPPTLATIAATLRSEFEHVRAYRPRADSLIFLASAAPIEPELQLARSGAPITNDVMHFSRMGMNGVEDLLAAFLADTAGIDALAGDARAHTDANVAARPRPRLGDVDAALDALAELDPLRQRGSWVYTSLGGNVNFPYIARRLAANGSAARALAAAEAHSDASTRLTMIGILHALADRHDQAVAAHRAALEQRPSNAQARYLLISSSFGPGAAFVADDDLVALAEELPASAAAAIEGRRVAGANDWAAVASLDSLLGQASVTDEWYPDVVRLRAEWRSKVTQNVEQRAFDALRLIDRVVLIQPDQNFFLLRAAIGIAIGDGDVAVESSRDIVRLVARMLEQISDGSGLISNRDVTILQQNMNVIVNNLRGTLVSGRERRAEEVRQGANIILRFLDAAVEDEQQ